MWRYLPTQLVVCSAWHEQIQWLYNERDVILNYRRLDCLFNRLLWHRSKRTPKLRVTGLCEWIGFHRWPVNSPHRCPVTRKMFPFDDVIVNIQAVNWWHAIRLTNIPLSAINDEADTKSYLDNDNKCANPIMWKFYVKSYGRSRERIKIRWKYCTKYCVYIGL